MSAARFDVWVHDARVLAVLELPSLCEVQYWLEYPVDWEQNIFDLRILRFLGVLSHQVKEGPFDGCPTLLESSTTEAQEPPGAVTVTLSTNAGTREVTFSSWCIEGPSGPEMELMHGRGVGI
jgi:hypothetical protein